MQRGTLRVKGGLKLLFEPGDADKDNYHRFMVKLAKSMLWYVAPEFDYEQPFTYFSGIQLVCHLHLLYKKVTYRSNSLYHTISPLFGDVSFGNFRL